MNDIFEEQLKEAVKNGNHIIVKGQLDESELSIIKNIDSNFIRVNLDNINEVDLIGLNTFNSTTKEEINNKPKWLLSIEEICAREPNKTHLVCFESTKNDKPYIQAYLLSLMISNKVSAKWILPSNAKIINSSKNFDSNLMEPFIKRFTFIDLSNKLVDSIDSSKNIETNNINLNIQDNIKEVIKNAFDKLNPVYVHVNPEEGISPRVSEIDPEFTEVRLASISNENFTGMAVYNPELGQSQEIKPEWLVAIEDICAKEPDKMHVILFSNLPNALPTVQANLFEIIANRSIRGKWKLPENARVMVSGEEINNRVVQTIAQRCVEVDLSNLGIRR